MRVPLNVVVHIDTGKPQLITGKHLHGLGKVGIVNVTGLLGYLIVSFTRNSEPATQLFDINKFYRHLIPQNSSLP